jgi:hypothetical protein
MLYINEINGAKLKNQKSGLIQDGDENIFYFSYNKPPFGVFSLKSLFLFNYINRTTTYQKMRTFHSAVVL